MNTVAKIRPDADAPVNPLERLRLPFPANQISKLPKETKKQADDRKADQSAGKWPAKCSVCEGYHHPKAVHLDYVGHAAATDRLLDVDPEWTWEPMAYTPEGLPAFDRNGGLWIKLTVCGVTRLGYGSADGKTGGDAIKEIIGDAIRNSGMRFGMALDLWHKGDLHAPSTDESEAPADWPGKPAWVTAAEAAIIMLRTSDDCGAWYKANVEMLKAGVPEHRDAVLALLKRQKEGLLADEKKAAKRFRSRDANPVAGSDGDASDPFGPADEIPF